MGPVITFFLQNSILKFQSKHATALPSSLPYRLSSIIRALLLVFFATFLVVSCGTEDQATKSCQLSYTNEGAKPLGEDKLRVTYRANLTPECTETVTKSTGPSVTKLQITALGAQGMYVEKLIFGERSFDFGEKYALEGGEFSSAIFSDTLKEWEFPWTDTPGSSSITIVVPKMAANSSWPVSVTVEIKSQN